MKKILVGVLVVVLVIVAIGAIIPAFLPSSIHVERKAVIERPPAEVYAVLTDFNQSIHWDPWVRRDPQIETTVTGTGMDMKYTWDGPEVGAGELSFIEMTEPSALRVAIKVTRPMEDEFEAGWNLQRMRMANRPPPGGPQPSPASLRERTMATWYVDFELGYFERYFGGMIEEMIGKDYEEGLANLKEYVEGKGAEE